MVSVMAVNTQLSSPTGGRRRTTTLKQCAVGHENSCGLCAPHTHACMCRSKLCMCTAPQVICCFEVLRVPSTNQPDPAASAGVRASTYSACCVRLRMGLPRGVLRSVCLPGMRSISSFVMPSCRSREREQNQRSATCKGWEVKAPPVQVSGSRGSPCATAAGSVSRSSAARPAHRHKAESLTLPQDCCGRAAQPDTSASYCTVHDSAERCAPAHLDGRGQARREHIRWQVWVLRQQLRLAAGAEQDAVAHGVGPRVCKCRDTRRL